MNVQFCEFQAFSSHCASLLFSALTVSFLSVLALLRYTLMQQLARLNSLVMVIFLWVMGYFFLERKSEELSKILMSPLTKSHTISPAVVKQVRFAVSIVLQVFKSFKKSEYLCKSLHQTFIQGQVRIPLTGELGHRQPLKVSKLQNEFMKSSFLPKYERKFVRVSALTLQGRNSEKFFVHILGETMTS